MPTLDLRGDFTRIDTALQKVSTTTYASFYPNSVNMSLLTSPDGLSAASGFTGTFSHITSIGTIREAQIELVNLKTADFLLLAKFSDFSVAFTDVFTITSSGASFYYSYRDTTWLNRVSTGDYVVNGNDETDDLLKPFGDFRFSGDDTMFAGGGNDTFSGGSGNDKILGNAGNDTLSGEAGKDQVFGNAGSDTLFGGSGNDILRGGGGHDRLSGQGGKDKLIGGGGKDVFVFSERGRDVIRDFKDGKDLIEVKAADGIADLHIEDTARGALVGFEEAQFLLIGIDAGDLTASDFIF